jgi:di/tricarboxylate transporter
MPPFMLEHWPKLCVAALTAASLTLLVSGRVTIDVVGIGLLAALVTTGIVDLRTALGGFSDDTIVMLAGLYVMSEGLTRTGALEFVARATLRASHGSERRVRLMLCASAALISSLVSDTAVVLVFLPIVLGVARDLSVPPSRFLMPVAFSALLGGALTLIGTSINLFASGAMRRAGQPELGFFELTPFATPAVAVGLAYLALFSKRLLPDRASVTGALAGVAPREYVTELVIGPTSPLLDRSFAEAFSDEKGPRLLFFVRDEGSHFPPFIGGRLKPGDVVVLQGDVQQLTDFQARLSLKMADRSRFDPGSMVFTELAVSPRSRVLGRRIADLEMGRDYDCAVVAVLREGHHIRERASDLVLRAGDLLLVCGKEASLGKLRASTDFYMLTGAHEGVVLRQHGRRALWILGVVVAAFVLSSSLGGAGRVFGDWVSGFKRWLPLPLVSLAGAVAMVAAGCLTARRAYRTIDWSILIFVVGALALGKAFELTGVADVCAHGMVALFSPLGTIAVASGFLLLTTLLDQFVAPYALVVLLAPIALKAAQSMGADPRPFLIAVALGGSNAFMSPMSHQVNLMVMQPGGYRYRDYLRLGIPLALLFWLVGTAMLYAYFA